MKTRMLALAGVALLLGACGGNDAKQCASNDVKAQLVNIFTSGPLIGRGDLFKDASLGDVAVVTKDPASGVLSCVGTLDVGLGQRKVKGVLEYRIAPAAASDHDYLLLDTNAERANAFAQRLVQVFPN
ncbi:MAG: hypothetical protein GAK43_00537 [Stenotrophomonas maltophilia]|nr:MAG: hypothetical protein GAK43_00537 [Stenotrophomonas maltophilia]